MGVACRYGRGHQAPSPSGRGLSPFPPGSAGVPVPGSGGTSGGSDVAVTSARPRVPVAASGPARARAAGDEPRCRRGAGSALGSGSRACTWGPPRLRPCPPRSPRPPTSCRVATGPRSSSSPANRFRPAGWGAPARQSSPRPRAAPGPGRQRSEFSLMAKRIGKDLSNTFAKLEKLTILAKRKSLFDDKSVEIEELTYIIKQDISSLNKQIAQLQELVRARGGPGGRHGQSHSNTVVVSLQSKLASMSNDFKSVLEVRTENLKQQRSRREHFSRAPVSALAANNLGSPAVLQDEPQRSGAVAIDMDSRASHQLQLLDEQDSYIQSRADTMQNIESTIVEL
ncbi:LOW QUALITY PROTEIN: syntaxin-5, partial [Corvus hawaiiensis]|uniref:LOW QUALITY PROTEIN: syntaxin-5 n=1 Tax=Corvus hawaiiensis TaxID=134902 RepID=UPI00201963B4